MLQKHTGGEDEDDDGAAAGGDGPVAALSRSFDERSTDRLAAVHVVSAEEAAAGAVHSRGHACSKWVRSIIHESRRRQPALIIDDLTGADASVVRQLCRCVSTAQGLCRPLWVWRAGTYGIDDVVLPLPGGKVMYPQHETAQVYLDTAAADGVSLEEAPHAVKEFQITCLVRGYLHSVLGIARVQRAASSRLQRMLCWPSC